MITAQRVSARVHNTHTRTENNHENTNNLYNSLRLFRPILILVVSIYPPLILPDASRPIRARRPMIANKSRNVPEVARLRRAGSTREARRSDGNCRLRRGNVRRCSRRQPPQHRSLSRRVIPDRRRRQHGRARCHPRAGARGDRVDLVDAGLIEAPATPSGHPAGSTAPRHRRFRVRRGLQSRPRHSPRLEVVIAAT